MDDGIRYVLSFAIAFAAAALLTPVAARLAWRLGIVDRPREGKSHREPMPYLGGVAVAAGLVAALAAAVWSSAQPVVIVLGALAVGAGGLVDDWRTLRPAPKLLLEGGAALALWLVGVRAGLFGVAALDLALTVVWVIAITNATNLLDNMDGLASGVAMLAALAFFGVAAIRGDFLVAQLALAIAGASAGFLLHNFPPAKVYLGDAGTLMLGFLLAALGLKLDMVGQNGVVRSAVPVLILAVPLLDTTFVVLRRLREHRPIVRGGTDHSSHVLASIGLSSRTIAIVTYLAATTGCAIAFAVHESPADVAVGLFVASAVAGASILAALLIVAANRPRSAATAGARLSAGSSGTGLTR